MFCDKGQWLCPCTQICHLSLLLCVCVPWESGAVAAWLCEQSLLRPVTWCEQGRVWLAACQPDSVQTICLSQQGWVMISACFTPWELGANMFSYGGVLNISSLWRDSESSSQIRGGTDADSQQRGWCCGLKGVIPPHGTYRLSPGTQSFVGSAASEKAVHCAVLIPVETSCSLCTAWGTSPISVTSLQL